MHRSLDIDRINEILHFTHAIESFPKLFLDMTANSKEWKPFVGQTKIDSNAYLASPDIINLLHWMRKYNLLCRFFDMRRYYIDEMADLINKLHSPKIVDTVDNFQRMLERFHSYVDFFEKDIKVKSKRLTCAECIRLDEAMVCYENYSYYASVIMAVSAVEGRITELIRRANRRLYLSTFSKFTLGQLIQVFEPGKFTDKKYSRIKKLMPEKHRPLVELLNRYRIFSAHPSEEAITGQIADSIMNLAFAFMLDENTCPYTEKELKHENQGVRVVEK